MTYDRLNLTCRYAYGLGARSGYRMLIVNGEWLPTLIRQASASPFMARWFRAALGRPASGYPAPW